MLAKGLKSFRNVGKRSLATSAASVEATYPAYILNATSTDVSTTSTGIKVASEATNGETATIGVHIGSGSRNETNSGTAYLLQRIALKGTSVRTQKQLADEIAALGGHFSVDTSREKTVYKASVFKSDVPKALEIIADILQNSKLDEQVISAEKAAILADLDTEATDMYGACIEHLHEAAFLGTALGRPVMGTEESVRSLSKSDLESYIKSQYTSSNFVVTGAGAVNQKQLVDLTEKYFAKIPSTPAGSVASKMEPGIFTGSDKRIRFDSMNSAHIAMAFQGVSWNSEHAFPMMLMQTILGSWSRTGPRGKNVISKWAQTVSEEDAAHSLKTFNSFYKDTGLFGVYIVAPDNMLDDVMWYTMDNLVRLCHNVSTFEVETAKLTLESNLLKSSSSSSSVVDDIGSQMLAYGRRIPKAEIYARIKAITTDDVKAAANKIINDEDHALSAIGPIFELPDYNWIRRRSYWHRY